MTRADFHVHTTFCDGTESPAAMVRAAIDRGLEAVGFAGHSHTPFDESWCMSPVGTETYRGEVEHLKAMYGAKIRIFCGVEQDFFSDLPPEGWDYVIGSVHYLRRGDDYLPLDESPELLRRAAAQYFGGDLLSLAEAYYETVAGVVERTGCSLIGHFDLIAKFNEGGALFDENDPRYVAAWQGAADALLRTGVPFEVNTGAIARGFRSVPYPSPAIHGYLAARGARFLLSGDAHAPDGLCFQFDRWRDAYALPEPPAFPPETGD